MAKIIKRGQRGAARAYVTRSAAVKKLQISLADFRRLCILKGIFPREPKHRKKANKGNSVSTSFYYAKDIAYLAHEPVLRKLRDHKAFAKKLSRALGRGEWSVAKSLDDNKPVYRLDHIIKERYPTFVDAVRDIDDALCLITLFASLPSSPRVPAALIESCSRLASEWQLYVMHTHALRKVFLSIKGIYFQAEVAGQTVTWLAPYMFTQAIPTDVDVRVMLTFLELYQTLLRFVFFKIYTDVELKYPPALDARKDDDGSGVNALELQSSAAADEAQESNARSLDAEGKPVKGRDVRKVIKEIASVVLPAQDPSPAETTAASLAATPDLPLAPSSSSSTSHIFSPYTFYLAPGCSRPLLEFTIRSFGGRVGWPSSMGSGSPIQEDNDSITHVIIDRPLTSTPSPLARHNRKLVQPQWVVDSINAMRVLPEGPYAQGATLPPHLSPFGEEYVHAEAEGADAMDVDAEDEEEEVDDEAEAIAEDDPRAQLSVAAAAAEAGDVAALRVAELAAERAGISTEEFDSRVGKSTRGAAAQTKAGGVAGKKSADGHDLEMNKMLMSNKQRKLYEKLRHSQGRRQAEADNFAQKRALIQKAKARDLRRAVKASTTTS